MKKSFPLLLFCVLSLGLVAQVFAQQPSTPAWQGAPPLSVEPVRRDIYEVKGGAGANAGFFVGESGPEGLDGGPPSPDHLFRQAEALF